MANLSTPPGMHRINLNAPIELFKRIQEEGVRQDRSASWIVRAAVEEYLARQAALRAEGCS